MVVVVVVVVVVVLCGRVVVVVDRVVVVEPVVVVPVVVVVELEVVVESVVVVEPLVVVAPVVVVAPHVTASVCCTWFKPLSVQVMSTTTGAVRPNSCDVAAEMSTVSCVVDALTVNTAVIGGWSPTLTTIVTGTPGSVKRAKCTVTLWHDASTPVTSCADAGSAAMAKPIPLNVHATRNTTARRAMDLRIDNLRDANAIRECRIC